MKSFFHYDKTKFGNLVNKICLNNFKSLDRGYWIITIVVTINFLILLLILANKICSTQNISLQQKKNSGLILRKVNEINDALTILKSYPTLTKQQEIAFQNMEKNIFSLQKGIYESAKTSEIQKMSNQIESFKDDIHTYLGELKRLITGASGNKQFIDASILPFHVIAVDVIAGQAYVSVDYDNHIFPLAIGDILAGWRVNNTDYDLNRVEFVNAKNEFIRLNMKGDPNENK